MKAQAGRDGQQTTGERSRTPSQPSALHHPPRLGRQFHPARCFTASFASLLLASLGLFGPAAALSFAAPTAMPSLGTAQHALLEGRADEASNQLHVILSADPKNGQAHLLLCRVLLSQGSGKAAATECRAALDAGLAGNSDAQDWTGRALGQQASNAGMLAGMRLALGVHTAFETAVSLAPNSEAACVDLGEYYTAAPAIVGGGTDKALALASRLEHPLPEVAHRIRAMAAEKKDDLVSAEQQFMAEANTAHRPGALVDLAAFYGRHHQNAKAVAIAQQTISADHATDATVVEAAGVLADAGNVSAAVAALRAYLEHGDHSDQAPLFRVHTQLGALLAHAGQREAARAEYTAALSLAAGYAPAQKGLTNL